VSRALVEASRFLDGPLREGTVDRERQVKRRDDQSGKCSRPTHPVTRALSPRSTSITRTDALQLHILLAEPPQHRRQELQIPRAWCGGAEDFFLGHHRCRLLVVSVMSFLVILT